MRIIPVTVRTAAAMAVMVVAWPAPTARAEEWMLMGREGGCVALAEAAERQPVLSGITSPDQLVDRLREQGEEVSREDLVSQGDVTVVQVDAPGLELGLIFTPPALCR